MPAPAGEIRRAEPGDQSRAVATERVELGDQRGRRTLAIAARASDLGLIPRFEQRLVAGENEPNAPGEAPPFGLDEMADDLLDAPLTGRRMPREDVVRMGRELRANRRGRALDQPGDLVRCEGPEWPRHRRVSSRAMTSR